MLDDVTYTAFVWCPTLSLSETPELVTKIAEHLSSVFQGEIVVSLTDMQRLLDKGHNVFAVKAAFNGHPLFAVRLVP